METDKVRAPNIRDVAAKAGVSYQTVSRVLNEHPSIRPTTRERVLEVIAEIGYRPNQAARALVTSRSRTIGVLTGQTAHYGPTTSVTAIEQAAREAGYRLSITSIASSEIPSIKSALDHMLTQSVEALVVIAPQVRVLEAIREMAIDVPYVTLQNADLDGTHSLSVDQVAGARMATEHLIELGHTEIMHISGPRDWIEAEARMQGYLLELTDSDFPVIPPILGDWTADFGYRAGRELVQRRRDFTAVFASNDLMALGLLHAFAEAGLSVPGDVSVIGFDDIPEAAHFWPPLATVQQDFGAVGRRAVALVLAELRGEPLPEIEPVAPRLVERASTGTPVRKRV